jgi:hypothetical protein
MQPSVFIAPTFATLAVGMPTRRNSASGSLEDVTVEKHNNNLTPSDVIQDIDMLVGDITINNQK